MPTGDQHLLERRRSLRKRMTAPERILWNILRAKQLQVRFRRQHSIGPFILDFYCPTYHVAIELDGITHEGNSSYMYDFKRTQYLNEHGIRVLRFTNEEIMKNIEGVYLRIQEFLVSSPLPPPSGFGS